MVKRKKYSIDFKLQVVGKYEQRTCGYKKLARAYGLSRDTVRSWCLNPRLREITTMARKKNINNEENDLEYYKTAALFWETYAKNVEAELAKQGKKISFENDAGLFIKNTTNEDTETLVKLQGFQSQHSIITGITICRYRRTRKS